MCLYTTVITPALLLQTQSRESCISCPEDMKRRTSVIYLLFVSGHPAVQSALTSSGLPVHSRHPDLGAVGDT